jgi:hypothetical protein
MAAKSKQVSGLSSTKLFVLIWRGWFVGGSLLLAPILLVLGLMGDRPRELLLAALLAPVIAALQGLMVGALVLLGLRIWPPRDQ